MVLAGDGSIMVGGYMQGGPGVPLNMKDSIQSSAQVVQQASAKLGQVASLLGTIETRLRAVKVPTLDVNSDTFDFPVMGSLHLVTGVEVDEMKPLGTIADLFDDAQGDLKVVKQHLSTTANQLSALSEAFEQAGENLKGMGDLLKQGGEDLKAFAD